MHRIALSRYELGDASVVIQTVRTKEYRIQLLCGHRLHVVNASGHRKIKAISPSHSFLSKSTQCPFHSSLTPHDMFYKGLTNELSMRSTALSAQHSAVSPTKMARLWPLSSHGLHKLVYGEGESSNCCGAQAYMNVQLVLVCVQVSDVPVNRKTKANYKLKFVQKKKL
jgi:hypothetical protein